MHQREVRVRAPLREVPAAREPADERLATVSSRRAARERAAEARCSPVVRSS
jgi:hypothetical protein